MRRWPLANMAMQLQGPCTTSLAYSSSLQFFSANLNSSLSRFHNCYKTASFKPSISNVHPMKNYPQICVESRSVPFSKEAYEAERLRLDAQARETMKAKAIDDSTAWKWETRKRIWDLMERGNIAQNPRPVHHRIPNFVGAVAAAQMGFAELEYGMLRYMGAIDDSTLIVTSVHDKQLVDDIPVEKLLIHDVPVDVICTPTQIIHSNTTIPKPQGIYWDRLSPEKLGQIQILRELKKCIEERTGQLLPCGPLEKLPPTAERRSRRQGWYSNKNSDKFRQSMFSRGLH